ncbi:MAG: 3-hydroxyacyl-CoA dehydrogenase [Flavobacteriales bacterium]|nr:3-hydroxyacyl-CoA dehydrogenase [Flavobacteriales bacterium]
MRIAAIGTPDRIKELTKKVSSKHELIEVKNNDFANADIVFDLNFDDFEHRLANYAHLKGTVVVVSAIKQQLEQVVYDFGKPIHCQLFGINALPTFLDRELAEMTSVQADSRKEAEEIFKELDWPIKWVESRVGMVTPRVVLMIINEAYYTVQEGTAAKEDIDIGMKLGTAYPKGPFEWANEIGLKNVYEVLNALYIDTHDERYKVCPMLKTEYLQLVSSVSV